MLLWLIYKYVFQIYGQNFYVHLHFTNIFTAGLEFVVSIVENVFYNAACWQESKQAWSRTALPNITNNTVLNCIQCSLVFFHIYG